jgi:hypothetical protein
MKTGLAIHALLPLLAEFNGLPIRHSVIPLFCAHDEPARPPALSPFAHFPPPS